MVVSSGEVRRVPGDGWGVSESAVPGNDVTWTDAKVSVVTGGAESVIVQTWSAGSASGVSAARSSL